MLRLLVLFMVLANAAFFAWSHGYLAEWGAAPPQQAEPQRLQQQMRPEAIRLIASDEARRIETAATARAPECLQAGPVDDAQASILRQELENWPSGTWSVEPATEPPRWIVYMGKYPNAEAVAKKKSELRQMSVAFDALQNPSLEPGISLGAFATQAEATTQLDTLTKRGVRTAKVVQELPEQKGQLLKLPAVDDSLRARLDSLKTALGAKPLAACRT